MDLSGVQGFLVRVVRLKEPPLPSKVSGEVFNGRQSWDPVISNREGTGLLPLRLRQSGVDHRKGTERNR